MPLTPQQEAAVKNRGGSLLVSAAAGSGKTRVLVDRLFRYITEERRNIDDFLIITYTRAAAAELRGKIAAELSRRMGEDPANAHLRRQLLRVYQADIKTVDAFCAALLRENTHLLAREEDKHALTPDFRVLDEGEALVLRRRCLDQTLSRFYETLTPGGEQLADTLGAGRDDSALVEQARQNLKYQLYTFANSAIMNVSTQRVDTWWDVALRNAKYVSGALCAATAAAWVILTVIPDKKKEEV